MNWKQIIVIYDKYTLIAHTFVLFCFVFASYENQEYVIWMDCSNMYGKSVLFLPSKSEEWWKVSALIIKF